ncbi:MAG TPA: hypothetical protein VLV18_02100 [Terriglobales bacterium]|nr:hypothetical protein [Terriglobales bacterium]
MSVVRCLEDKVHQTSGIMREIELTPIRRVLSLQSNRDVSSACLVKPGSVPSFFKIESNQETKPRVETDDPRQTFVVTDLLDDSQYVVISEPLGNTIISRQGQQW